jgi:hypothetical protein
MAPSQPAPEVFGDAKSFLDVAAQISCVLQISGKFIQDYAQMIDGHPASNMRAKQSESFHAWLGTKGFSRPRHYSSTTTQKKGKAYNRCRRGEELPTEHNPDRRIIALMLIWT